MVEAQINHSQIEEYAKKVADQLAEQHFGDHETINGQDILRLSEVKQVNFFILKNLFEKWQEETRNLRSPYFNYKSEKVTKALVAFMNTLSQNIEINRDDFEPLLVTAVQDTLYLTFTPFDHFWADLSQGPDTLTIKNLKAKGKYIKHNKHIYDGFLEYVIQATEDKISKADALTLLEGLIADDNHKAEDNETMISQLSQIHPLDMEEIYKTDVPEVEAEVPESDEDVLNDLFDEETLVDQEPEASEPDPIVEDQEEELASLEEETEEELESSSSEVVDDPAPEISSPEPDEAVEETEDVELVKEEPEQRSVEEPELVRPKKLIRKPVVDTSTDEEAASNSENQLNQKFNQEKPTLNDQLKDDEKVTIADIHETQGTGKMQESISVNQRYMFINELFQGNADQYTQAINDIERCESFDDSVELMIQKYAKKLDWNMNSQEVKELLKVIFKRYR